MANDPLTSAFKQQPETLDSPIPNAGRDIASNNISLDFSGLDTQEEPAREFPKPGDSDFALDASALETPVMMNDEFGVPVEMDPSGPLGGTFSEETLNPEQLGATRFAVGLLKTPKEKEQFLQQRLGPDNVKRTDDNFLVRWPGKKSFKKLDSESFELFADLFSDESRATLSGMAASSAMGAAMVAPTHPAAKFLTVPIAGWMGASGSLAAIDAAATNILGVDRDPARGGTAFDPETMLVDKDRTEYKKAVEMVQENLSEGATTAAIEGMFKAIGLVAKGQRMSSKSMKNIRETPPPTRAKENVENMVEANVVVERLAVENGNIVNIPGTDTKVPANFVLGTGDAQLQAIGDSVLPSNEGQKIIEITRNNLVEAVDDLNVDVFGKEVMGKVGKRKANPTILGNKVRTLLRKKRREEGRAMQQMINEARDLPNPPNIQTIHTAEPLNEIMAEFGIKPRIGGVLEFPEGFDKMVRNRMKSLGADKEMVAEATKDFKDMLVKLHKIRDGVALDPRKGINDFGSYNNFVEDVNALTATFMNTPGKTGGIGAMTARLNAALRLDRVDIIDQHLLQSDNLQRSFGARVKGYRDAIVAEKALGKLMNENIIANKAVIKGLFGTTPKKIERLHAVKNFLENSNPEAWASLKASFIEQVMKESTDAGKLNFKKFHKKMFDDFGDDYVQSVFGKKDYSDLKKVLALGGQFERLVKKGSGENARGIFKEMVGVVASVFRGSGSMGLNPSSNFLRFGTSERKRLMQILDQKPIEYYIEGVAPEYRSAVGETLRIFFNASSGTASQVGQGALGRPIRTQAIDAGIEGTRPIDLGERPQ